MRLLPFAYAVRNLGRSPSRLFLSVAGAAMVVLLILVAGGFVRGMSTALRATGYVTPNSPTLSRPSRQAAHGR